jgi:hypothetical protein
MASSPVGEIRPSQLLWTYGPGALIDLPSMSVLTMGLERWDASRCAPVDEARLLAAVRRIVGPQVEALRLPPIHIEDGQADFGVPVKTFPRWLRCVKCQTLAPIESGLFLLKPNQFRPELTTYIHQGCERGNRSEAVPARFMVACRSGHLDDFPWRYYVHLAKGNFACTGTLKFIEDGASMQTENLWVKCGGCGASRSMAQAFGEDGQKNLPACRGRHPHLNKYDSDCQETARAVLLGATNSWFSVSLSALAIPLSGNLLTQVVLDGWNYFEDCESEAEVATTIKILKKSAQLPGIENFSPTEVWDAVAKKREGVLESHLTEAEIKRPEWKVLTDPTTPSDWPHFLISRAKVPEEFSSLIEYVLLLERLREVNALIGFTRVEAAEESSAEDERPPMAPLSRESPKWIPASDVHGEGFFIKFREDAVREWENRLAVKNRNDRLTLGHKGWRASRRLNPALGYPGIRYAMIHTVSHLLIRELALECGYNAASIRERIYSDSDASAPMAGMLLYTAAADSDGTLGGLVELGRPENLGRLLRQALGRATICSSDPLCSEHDPSKDRSLHGASCHACGFAAETSCERGNRYLDRALIVPTFDCKDAAFFPPSLCE